MTISESRRPTVPNRDLPSKTLRHAATTVYGTTQKLPTTYRGQFMYPFRWRRKKSVVTPVYASARLIKPAATAIT